MRDNKIVLDNNFYVVGDAYQWTLYKDEELQEISEKTGKKKRSKDQWYFPNLKLALRRYADESLKKSPDIIFLMQRIDELEETIEDLCQKQN